MAMKTIQQLSLGLALSFAAACSQARTTSDVEDKKEEVVLGVSQQRLTAQQWAGPWKIEVDQSSFNVTCDGELVDKAESNLDGLLELELRADGLHVISGGCDVLHQVNGNTAQFTGSNLCKQEMRNEDGQLEAIIDLITTSSVITAAADGKELTEVAQGRLEFMTKVCTWQASAAYKFAPPPI